MEGKDRREAIINELLENSKPITGAALAKKYSVSRQVIVQDIALLRAQGIHVISTGEGYFISQPNEGMIKRAITVKHYMSDIEEELNIIVDNGGNVLNVIVSHPIYGEIEVDMMISSRKSVQKFMKSMSSNNFVPLMHLTGGEHLHIIEAEDEETLDDIENELFKKGYLVKL